MEIGGVELDSLEFEHIGSWPLVLRNLILIGVFLMVLLLGYFFDLSDKLSALDNVQAEREQLQLNYTKLYHQALNLDAYRLQVDTVKKTLAEVTKQLPTNNEEAQLLEELSQKAISSGLLFRSIKPGPEERKGFYNEQQFEMALQGTYHGFGQFASALANMHRIVTMHDFTVQKINTGDKLDIAAFVKIYWISPEGMLR